MYGITVQFTLCTPAYKQHLGFIDLKKKMPFVNV